MSPIITREVESDIRSVFRDAMQNACENLAERNILDTWWPDGYSERLAEIATQSVCMMAESCIMGLDHE